MRRTTCISPELFLVLYMFFTAACGCLHWLKPQCGFLLFEVWYLSTAFIWLVLMLTVGESFDLFKKISKGKKSIDKGRRRS